MINGSFSGLTVLSSVVLASGVVMNSLCQATELVDENVMVRMRDGVTIKTYVKTPSGRGPWPAVLKKGYGITTSGADRFPKPKYVYVSQGVRAGADPHGISGNATTLKRKSHISRFTTMRTIQRTSFYSDCRVRRPLKNESNVGLTLGFGGFQPTKPRVRRELKVAQWWVARYGSGS